MQRQIPGTGSEDAPLVLFPLKIKVEKISTVFLRVITDGAALDHEVRGQDLPLGLLVFTCPPMVTQAE
jgi:hypothetical protein